MKAILERAVFFSLLFLLSAAAPASALASPPLADESGAPLAQPPGLVESLLSASLIVQLAFLVLLVMSIVSWAVILQKGMALKRAKEENSRLSNVFLRNSSFEDIYKLARANGESSLARIFSAGYEEMTKVLSSSASGSAASPAPGPAPPPPHSAAPSAGSLSLPASPIAGEDNIERALRKEIQTELSYMESGLGFLATAGNSCPFIGLFGTVFGIMDAFGKIAATGSAGLAVVAPGIAEALFATGLGLFAAIPAAVFYNLYISRLKKLEMEFHNFAADFVNIAKRNFFMPRRS